MDAVHARRESAPSRARSGARRSADRPLSRMSAVRARSREWPSHAELTTRGFSDLQEKEAGLS